jgi:uncharacterized protein (DUF2147 family)
MLATGRFIVAAVIAAAGAFSTAAVAQSSPEGFWVDEDGSFVVQVFRCGAELCGELVGLQPDDVNRLDTENTDRSKRQRPWCGLDVLGDLKPSTREAGKWEGGWIYNPKDGKTYSSEVRLGGPDRLRIRGSVLGGLLGKNLNLVREQGMTWRCREQFTADQPNAENEIEER